MSLKKRMDHQYTYYRKSLQEEVVFTSPFGDEAGVLNTRSNYVEYAMKYALTFEFHPTPYWIPKSIASFPSPLTSL